jgi:hypothetical protein
MPEVVVFEVDESEGNGRLVSRLRMFIRDRAVAACWPTEVEEAAKTISMTAV